MSDNIGENLKGLAKVIGIICLSVGCIAGLFTLFSGAPFLSGIIYIAAGVGLYFSCYALYGLGELIELAGDILSYACKIKEDTKKISDK